MTRSNRRWNAVCLLLFPVLLFVLLWLNGRCGRTEQGNVVADTTHVLMVDTVTVRFPQAVDSAVVRVDTVRLPVVVREETPTAVASCASPADSTESADSVAVSIPIVQKRYGDSTYTAWVSGYCVQIDSIRVYPRREVTTVRQTTVRRVAKRWGIGVVAGYGFTPHGLQPYIGLGVQWNVLSFGKWK